MIFFSVAEKLKQNRLQRKINKYVSPSTKRLKPFPRAESRVERARFTHKFCFHLPLFFQKTGGRKFRWWKEHVSPDMSHGERVSSAWWKVERTYLSSSVDYYRREKIYKKG
jgi:hypothetical protein